MPRLRYTPSDDDRFRARDLAAIGASHDDIAAQLRVPLPKLEKIFKDELRAGAAHGRELALRKLHALATSGDSAPMLSFWVKAQCGWRDTGAPQGITAAIRHVLVIGKSEKGHAQPPA